MNQMKQQLRADEGKRAGATESAFEQQSSTTFDSLYAAHQASCW